MYPTFEEMIIKLNQIKEKYRVPVKEKVEDILFAIFCNAYKYGKEQISIQQQEIENYLPNLKFLLCDCCHLSSLLFESEEGSYRNYLTFLQNVFCQNGLGIYQRTTASIQFHINPYYRERILRSMEDVTDIIELGSAFLLQEVPVYYLKQQVLLTLHQK